MLNIRLASQPGRVGRDVYPPKFAISDFFVADRFSEIDDTTPLKRQTIGLAQTRGVVKVIFGGPGNILQSHLLSWDNRHATIPSRVPRQEDFQVVLAGPITPR